MQALAGFVCQFGKVLETDRRIDEVAKNEAGRIRLATEKERGGFIEKRLGKLWVSLNALNDGLLEITGQRHTFFLLLAVASAFFLALYSLCRVTA